MLVEVAGRKLPEGMTDGTSTLAEGKGYVVASQKGYLMDTKVVVGDKVEVVIGATRSAPLSNAYLSFYIIMQNRAADLLFMFLFVAVMR